jgi:hypothetical protein
MSGQVSTRTQRSILSKPSISFSGVASAMDTQICDGVSLNSSTTECEEGARVDSFLDRVR